MKPYSKNILQKSFKVVAKIFHDDLDVDFEVKFLEFKVRFVFLN